MRNRKWINYSLILVLLFSFVSPYVSIKAYASDSGITLLNVTEKEDSTVLVWEVVNDEEIANYQLIKNGEVKDIEPVSLSESADGNVKRYSYEDINVEQNTPYTYEIAAYTSSGNQLVSSPIEYTYVGQVEEEPTGDVEKGEETPVVDATELTEREVVTTNIKVVTDQGNIPCCFDFAIEGATEELADVSYYGYLDEEGYFVDYDSESSNLELPVGTYRLVANNYSTDAEISAEFTIESGQDYVTSPIELVFSDDQFVIEKYLYVEGTTEQSISIWWEEPWFPEEVDKYNIYLNDELLEEISDPSQTSYTFSGLLPDTSYEVKVEIVYLDGTVETLSDVVTTSLPPTGEIVEFADENLEAAIKEQLRIYHREIYTDDMEKLTYLDASYMDITDISGLEYAVNLVDLMLYGNQIEDITSLAALTNLSFLDLDENLITNIDSLVNLKELDTLFLAFNQLEDISVLTELPNLTHVTLYGNDGLDFSKGSEAANVLKTLMSKGVMVEWNFGSNELFITEVTETTVGIELYFPEVEGFVSSYRIYMNGEFIEEIPATETYYELIDLEPLSELEISVEAVDEEGFVWGSAYAYVTTPPVPTGNIIQFNDRALEEAVRESLHIYSRDLFESDMTILTSLHADDRGITDLSGLEFATNLVELYLDSNFISDIEPLAGLTKIGYLSLSNNELTDVSSLANLTNLESLMLDRNGIEDISFVSSLTKLAFLSVQENYIKDISPLAGLNLEFLNISFNDIEDISTLLELENLVFVLLLKNPIDLTDGSDALAVIQALEENGVTVLYEYLDIVIDDVTDTSVEFSWVPVTRDGYDNYLYTILVDGEEVATDIEDYSYILADLESDTDYTIEIIGFSSDEERIIYGTTVVTTASGEEDPTDGEDPIDEPGEGTVPDDDNQSPDQDEEKGNTPDKDSSTDKDTSSELPTTATNTYNRLAAGLALLIVGAFVVVIARRKTLAYK